MKIQIHLIFHLGNVDLAKMLLKNGFQIDAKDAELGWSPLLRATKLGIHISNCYSLFELKAFNSIFDSFALGHLEMVKFLLESGANINFKSWHNVTSIHLATAWS